MIGEVWIGTGDGLASLHILGFKIYSICGKYEPGFRPSCSRTCFQFGKGLCNFAMLGNRDVDVVRL